MVQRSNPFYRFLKPECLQRVCLRASSDWSCQLVFEQDITVVLRGNEHSLLLVINEYATIHCFTLKLLSFGMGQVAQFAAKALAA